MKKIFVISSALLVVVLLFLGIYNLAFKESGPDTAEPVEALMQAVQPSEENKIAGKLVVFSDEAVISPVLDSKNETLFYYSKQEKNAWKIDLEREIKQEVSPRKFEGIKNANWSPDRNKAILTIENKGKVSFIQYDLEKRVEKTLKSGLDNAVWDNLGTKIFYKYYNAITKERSINIANPDGNEWKKLADTEYKSILVSPVPLSSEVAYWNFPNANEETKLSVVGVSGGDPRVILQGKFGADYLWSPDGKKILVSSLSSQGSGMTSLGIVTPEGEYSDLNIPTIVSKCAWSSDGKTVYFALPGEIPESAIMPNDYQDRKFFTDDTFWKVDVTTGRQERIIEASDIPGKFDSTNLFLSSTEDSLFFVNRTDDKIYKIDF